MTRSIQDDLIDVSESKLEKKLEDFSRLIEQIDNLPDKQRALWREAYENALADRHNAFLMFREAVKVTQSANQVGAFSSNELAVHGKTIATFLEKMSKANDQLLRLAEMIGKVTTPKEDALPDWAEILKKG